MDIHVFACATNLSNKTETCRSGLWIYLLVPQVRIVDIHVHVFACATNPSNKTESLYLFKSPSNLSIIVATSAFAVDFDCTDIRQIIHVGLPDNICTYIQGTCTEELAETVMHLW